MTKSTIIFLRCHSHWNHTKKSRNNSKLESGPNVKAAYGSCYKVVASLMTGIIGFFLISKEFTRKRWRAKKSTCLLGGSLWRGKAENLLDVPSNYMVERIHRKMKEQSVLSSSSRLPWDSPWMWERRMKGDLCHHSTIKYGTEHSHLGSKTNANCKHGFHSDHLCCYSSVSLLAHFLYPSFLSSFLPFLVSFFVSFFLPADSYCFFLLSSFLPCFSTSAFSLLYLSVL